MYTYTLYKRDTKCQMNYSELRTGLGDEACYNTATIFRCFKMTILN